MNEASPDLRFAVLQPGARMHYAIPALLAEAGQLQRFYTDICASVGPLATMEHFWRPSMRPKSVARLLGRRLPDAVPREKIRHLGLPLLAKMTLNRLLQRASPSIGGMLMDMARNEGLGGANALYTNLINEDVAFCEEARRTGIAVVHEVMLSPDVGLWMIEEHARHPDSPEAPLDRREVEEGRERDRQKFAAADLILVPSAFVNSAMEDLGADPDRIAMVPYGVSEDWFAIRNVPRPGRILSVGTVGLRKGHHYLAQAVGLLAELGGVQYEGRVVGPVERRVALHPLFRGPTYLGQVPRSWITGEYASADVFVLPSLAEGMATVTLEALAAGIPVVTTPNAGSCVRDGVDGFIVPARDAEALAKAIATIVTDRELRGQMSANARERAQHYTWSRYGARLTAALARLEQPVIGLRRSPTLVVPEQGAVRAI